MSGSIEIKDLRSGERFVVAEGLFGTFGAADCKILNVAEQGAQIAHTQPIRIAARARLWFKRGEASANVHGFVVWSHLSKTPDDSGAYFYHSGVRVEDANAFAAVLQSLADQGVLRRDHESLERKKERLAQREQERKARPVVKFLHNPDLEVPNDQALLVQHARERLRLNPEEAQKWYNRARFAVAEDGAPVSEQIRNREDVMAVWEYLERTVSLSTIVRVFERNRIVPS